jgi:hypothetical protein
MQKTLFVASFALIATALAPRHSVAEQPKGAPPAADALEASASTPSQLKAVEQAWRRTQEAVAKYEKDAEVGTLRRSDLQYTRSDMFGVYFGRLIRGGEPPCEVCKNAPIYKQMKADFPALNARLSRLEKRYFKCDYGYLVPGDKIVPLDVNWSEEEWKKIEGEARPANYTQKNHCHKSTKEQDWVY